MARLVLMPTVHNLASRQQWRQAAAALLCEHTVVISYTFYAVGNVATVASAFNLTPLHHSWWQPCDAEEEKAAAEAEAAAAAREATLEVSEDGEIAVDPEELEEIAKAQQQAVSKQAQTHSTASKQAIDRGRDRDRDRGLDRDKGHPGRDRQVPILSWCPVLCGSLPPPLPPGPNPHCLSPRCTCLIQPYLRAHLQKLSILILLEEAIALYQTTKQPSQAYSV